MRAAVAAALVVAAAVAPAGARAQETAALRPCRPDDVPGVWDVVRLRASSGWRVDRSQPYYFQYQRYVFTADGQARHLTATMPIGPAQHEALTSAPVGTRWSLDERGWLTVDKEQGAPDVSECQVVERQIVDDRQRVTAMPGEVLLTYYARGAPVMRRQLARHRRLMP
jgi:hypothetical protein